jgi:glycosyltransferase involved in cell wall biosynthesis
VSAVKESAGPTVSVGLPVYNGADYLAQAIESLLGQTFEDFELLVQDNASTDATEEICRSYAAADPRVSYVCNAQNVGAAANYNLVFQRARGRYFKWAAHDDVCTPDFLERCVEVLDRDAAVVLCCGQTQLINDDGSPVAYDWKQKCYVTRHGERVGQIDPDHRAEGARPASRFWDVLVRTMRTFEIFGLIRADVLRKTRLHGGYYGSDKVLLAELSLLGRFHLLPQVLLYRRCHRAQSSNLALTQKSSWIGGGRRDDWLTLRLRNVIPGYVDVVRGAPIALADKVACYGAIAYRLVAPQTWIKQFLPGRYTET